MIFDAQLKEIKISCQYLLHIQVCVHAFCPPSRDTEVKVPFVFPDLPVSVACLASCELMQLSRLLPRELP